MRQNSQFNLRVVKGKEKIFFLGAKCLSNQAAILGSDGNVLQIRMGRGKPSGGCSNLIERSMEFMGF